MKKHALLLMTGSLLALASCTNDNNTGMTQTQIDSAVDARVRLMEAEMAMKNDSMINALAQIKADSMIAAMGTRNTASPSTPAPTRTTTRTNTPKTTTPTRTKDGRLNTDVKTSKDNDGRLNTDKNTESKDKTKGKDGRLKTD